MEPENKISFIARNETVLSYAVAFATLAMLLHKEDLFAQSVAIHDKKTAQDSIEAELLTENWVEFPGPYYDATEFRRRPNDRCQDIVVPLKILTDEGITPEGSKDKEE